MIAKFSVKKTMTVLVGVVLILMLGIVAFTRMTPDLLPNIDLPYVMVITSYVGASPEEIEQTVTKPIEQSVATLDHIKGFESQSSENMSMVMMEFSSDADMDAVSMNIREKMNLLESGWDSGVGTPTILKLNPNMMPLAVYAASREGYDAVEMSTFFDDTLSSALEGVEGVASVSASGKIQESVKISLREDKMAAMNEKIAAAVEDKFKDGEKRLSDSAESIAESWDKLIEGQAGVDEAKEKLKTAKKEIEKQFENTEKSLNTKLTQLKASAGYLSLEIERIEKLPRDGSNDAEFAKLPQHYSDLSQLNSAISELTTAIAALPDQEKKAIQSLYGSKEKLADSEEAFADTRDQLKSSEESIKDSREQLADSKTAALENTDMKNLLSISTVTGILTAQNFSMPAGYAKLDNKDCLIYVGDKLTDVEELKDMILFDLKLDDIDPIRLSDVADVYVTDNSADTYARINGSAGLSMAFFKQSGYATAQVSENLEKKMAALSEKYPGLSFTPLMDQGEYINIVIKSVLDNLLLGAILAVLILLLFLRDIRPTFVVACSIPISVTFAIVLMYFSGVTLNIISMSGLAVGVGMLVDNSIVVIENIYRLRKKGVSVFKACISGASQVAGAITASTLTTVCVFLPIVFVEGITRQLFSDMALTIGYSLMASLVVSLTLVPALSSGTLKKTADKEDKLLNRLQGTYLKGLSFVLRHRVLSFLLSIVLLIATTVLALSKGFTYMPEMESSEVNVTITMKDEEATMQETAAVADRIAARIELLPEVETVGAMAAGNAMSMMGFGGSTTNQATVYVVLSEENKGRSSSELVPVIEGLCADQPVDFSVSGGDSLSGYSSALGGSGVVVYVYSEDLDDLKNTAREVAARLENVEGLTDISDGLEDADPALRITVDKSKAMEQGLTVAQVFQYLAGYLKTNGDVAEFEKSNQNVILETAEQAPSVKDVKNKTFTFADKEGKYKTVKLSDIATFTDTETLSSVLRSNQRRYLTVTAALEEGYNVTLQTSAAMRELASYTPPSGTSVEFSGENETIMNAMKDLLLLMVLGIAIVYLIMVAQFQSLLSPLIVMATIPLAFTGGLAGLLIANMEVSIVGMIGFVMLVGIIVNNGIVLIDAMNQLRIEGMAKREAVLEACSMRLRPVLMTALTTILGLVPLGMGRGMGAGLVQPVAVVAIGGLIYATFMTLFVVPALYDLAMKKPPRVLSKEDLELYED